MTTTPPPQQPQPLSPEEGRRRAKEAFKLCEETWDDWQEQMGEAHQAGGCACCSSTISLRCMDEAMAKHVATIRAEELENPYMVRSGSSSWPDGKGRKERRSARPLSHAPPVQRPTTTQLARALGLWSNCVFARGRRQQAIALLAEVAALLDNPTTACRCCVAESVVINWKLGLLLCDFERWAEAEAVWRRALKQSTSRQRPDLRFQLLRCLAELYLETGRLAEALEKGLAAQEAVKEVVVGTEERTRLQLVIFDIYEAIRWEETEGGWHTLMA